MRLDEGKQLGDWKLIKEIGYGAIGQSFVAEHRFTKQKVVLKILPEDLASDRSFVMRFEDEALMLATLDHPGIARINTVSFIEGLYILIVECVVDSRQEMKTLATLAKEVSLSPRQILSIARQLAEALDYAHSVKSIGGRPFSHGNLKPSNVLIHASSSDEPNQDSKIRVKISDFGLSRIVGQASWLMRSYRAMIEKLYADEVKGQIGERGRGVFGVGGVNSVSSNSLASGNYGFFESRQIEEMTNKLAQNIMFLSPEQRRGDWSTSHESDVWSFGVILYWLMTGSYPEGVWDSIDFTSSSEAMLLGAIIRNCLRLNPNERPCELLPLFHIVPAVQQIKVAVEEKKALPEAALISVDIKEDEVKLAAVSLNQAAGVISSQTQKNAPQESDFLSIPLQGVHAASSAVSRPKVSEESYRNIKEYIPEKREPRLIQPIDTDMVTISQGNYMRGSNQGCRDETPRHSIRLNSFKIDVHPVTNEQFVRFLETLGDEKDRYNHDIIRLRDSRIKKSGGKFVIERGYAKHPVVGVTWYGATAYADWIGKRLPTEAEWEVACCGGLENPPYPTGETIERSQANFFSSDTTPVMSYPANEYGIYDLAGNVYEWCSDWYEYNYYDFSAMEPDYPKGPIQGVYRVLRGGCWKSLKEDLRCAKRHRNNPGAANGTYGFRCAKDAE